MILHLVRHGQTPWNVQSRVQGQVMDIGLTPTGRAQMRDAARNLAHRCIAEVISSDLLRATESAAIIAGVLGLEITTTPLLREQDLGSLEGRHHSELEPQAVPSGQHISEVAWGGGESLRDVHRRLSRFMAALSPVGEEVVLVSHADALRVLEAVVAGRSHREVEWHRFDNGEVRTLRL